MHFIMLLRSRQLTAIRNNILENKGCYIYIYIYNQFKKNNYLNLNNKECYLNFSMNLILSSYIIIQLIGLTNNFSISIFVQYTDISSRQFIKVWHHWINALLLGSCDYNKWSFKAAALSSGIPVMWQKTNKVRGYCKIMLGAWPQRHHLMKV